MEKNKILILLCFLLLAGATEAQNFHASPFLRKGMMKISSGGTAGVMAANPVQEIFLTANFSYSIEDRIAVRTDFFLFMPDYNFEGELEKNSSILLGPEFNFPYGRFDLALLFEPGLSFTRLAGGTLDNKVQAEPVMTFSLATYYFLFQNFHVFASACYLHGNYFLESQDPFRLDEFRITAGLGINIFVNHQPAFQRKRTRF